MSRHYQSAAGFVVEEATADLQSGAGFWSLSGPTLILGSGLFEWAAWEVEAVGALSITGVADVQLAGAWEVEADALVDGIHATADFDFPALYHPVRGVGVGWSVEAAGTVEHQYGGIVGLTDVIDMPGAWVVEAEGYLEVYGSGSFDYQPWQMGMDVTGRVNVTQRGYWQVEAAGLVSNYSKHLADQSRIPSAVVTMDPDNCIHDCGVSPCYAVGRPCYKTLATCRHPAAYEPSPKRDAYCLNDVPVTVGQVTRPYIKDVKIHALEVLTGDSLILNSKARITFYDESCADYGVDPYRVDDSTRSAPSGDESVEVGGTYWRRWRVRNKYYKGRRLSVWQGFDNGGDAALSDYYEEFKGVIDNVKFNADGTVTVTANGLLQLTADIELPRKVDGALWVPIDKEADTLQLSPWAGVDSKTALYTSKYSSGLILIESEVIAYDAVHVDQSTGVTTFTGLNRGMHNQYGWAMAKSHELDAAVSEVHFLSGNPIDIILQLFRMTGLEDSELNLISFESVKGNHLDGVYFAAVISEPIKIKELIAELREQTGTYIWQDENQQVAIRFIAPAEPGVVYRQITDNTNIIFDSSSLDDGADQRITRAAINYNHSVGSELKEGNFYRVVEYRSVDAEHEYGHGEIKPREPIYSRWIWSQHGGDYYAYDLISDLVELRINGASKIKFDLELKDMTLALGEVFEGLLSEDGDENGNPETGRYMVTKRERVGRGKYRYTAELTRLDGRWLFISPDEFVDDWLSAPPEQQAYGCISDDSGLAPDGGEGFKISRGY